MNLSEHCKHIVLVEDDHSQSEDFQTELQNTLGPVRIDVISCEAEFLDAYSGCPEEIPDLFVIDLMLEWNQLSARSTRAQPKPAPNQDEAGLRCLAAVRNYAPNAPVIIWTVTNMKIPSAIIDGVRTWSLIKDEALDGDFGALAKKVLYGS
ncbi:MAG: hypothetical protein ABL921_31125 [Pirellula sp.]